jgi:hopanoid biosynthesis associated RND transporter like protein HpnN
MGEFIARIVEWSRSHALKLVAGVLVLTLAGGIYSARNITIDTDLDKLISQDLPWRLRAAEMDKAFPQNVDLLVAVIDGVTPDQAEDAATDLADKLKSQDTLFRNVRVPDGIDFFRQNGMLFLPKDQVQDFADQIIKAQPFLGTLAADPSLRGVLGSIGLLAQGVGHGDVDPQDIAPALNGVSQAVENALTGTYAPLSWEKLLSGRKPDPRELRRIVLAQAALNYDALAPGEGAVDQIHQDAADLGLTPDRGVRVRITGEVALNDAQLAALSEGALFSTLLSVGLLCVWLFLALSSTRIFLAIIITLAVGLIACTTFAVGAIGSLNPISVAFAVLFVGIAVDFGIQFSVRYRDERYRVGDLAEALRRTAGGIGRPMAVAAIATAAGFFSFVPTDYTGVSDLGLIAGVGMLIALVLNLTLLPALIALMRPRGEPRAVGFAWAAPIDRFLIAQRLPLIILAMAIAVGSAALLPGLRFDFNPLNLQDPKAEAVSTLFDLMSDPMSTPYVIQILTPSPSDAADLSNKLDALPEVDQSLTIGSFVPDDQDAKLAMLADVKTLLGPSLSPPVVLPAPMDPELMAAIAQCAAQMKAIAGKDPAAARLEKALESALAQGPTVLPALKANLSDGVKRRLDDMRMALNAQKVSLDTIPDDLKRDWVTADGRALVEVFPKGDARENSVLRQFVAAVSQVAPDATGTPVTIQESAKTVINAFLTAGIIAVVAIAILLLAVLRRVEDVALVLGPLLLAGLMTLATSVLVGLPLNYANIIALPLLLGVGVSFDVYFVMRWRAGANDLLQSSTARAILFSALTTGTAFGSLALSNFPGTSEMGKLLTIALVYTLFCTFVILPALLGALKRD